MDDHEFDTFLRDKINEAITPASSSEKLMQTWNAIEAGLAREKKQSTVSFSLSIAASILVLFLVIEYTRLLISSEEKISYRQETTNELSGGGLSNNDTLYENEILSMLERKCQVKTAVCNTEEFYQLKFQLDELDKKEEEIQTELQRYGQAPSVLKALMKIRIMKVDVLKKLLKL